MSPRRAIQVSAVACALLVGACAVIPSGPSVLVLPGSSKTFDQFRHDDAACRQFAAGQLSGKSVEQAAVDSGVASAVLGTVVGAAAGAAIGGSRGAGVGAGAGLVVGSAAGSSAASYSYRENQQRYDHAYQQCMYAMGHRVPVYGRYSVETRPSALPPPPPPGAPPPPPPR